MSFIDKNSNVKAFSALFASLRRWITQFGMLESMLQNDLQWDLWAKS